MHEDEVRRRRLEAQRLGAGRPRATPAQLVRALVGVQAQDRRAAPLAIRARTHGVSAEAVEDALRSGAVVRTWAMRGTLHLLAADDLPLALALFGPLVLRRARRRLAELGLPPDAAERATAEAAAVLADEGPLTRHELAEHLRARGVPVAAEGQAPAWVVGRAAGAGVLCEVGVRGLEPLYGRLELGPLPEREDALRRLARRYHAAHAPAAADDFAAWSGLPAGDVRRAWQATDDPPDARAGEPGPVRLLPAFDEWMLGWASREPILPREHARRAVPGGGIIRPVAIADGRVFATWLLDRPRGRVEIEPFATIPKRVRAALDDEVAAVLDFVG